MKKADFLIVGGGITGLTIARELIKRGYENIIIIEKENSLAKHASGRNSGVLHAGIYYAPDSLKAKFCLKGNFLMREYCKERGLPILETGKVIVIRNEREAETLKGLYKRAIRNGARVELIDERQLSKIEPNAKTYKMGLYSYYTAVVDPKRILNSLYEDLASTGKVKIFMNTKFKDIKQSSIALTDRYNIEFDIFINAAGAYADKIAHSFGLGLNYKLIPFKGTYKRLKKEKSHLIRGNIYPVPDIRNPFLGVHFTKDIRGDVYLGPTAIPAFGRENYGITEGIDKEAMDIFIEDVILFFVNPRFREIALQEPRKYMFNFFYRDAKKLVKRLLPEWIEPSDRVGIRPQLVDWEKKELVKDFVVIKDGNTIHILNTISPAFTSSMAFAKFVVNNYVQ